MNRRTDLLITMVVIFTFLILGCSGGGGGGSSTGGSSTPPPATTDYSGNWVVNDSLTYCSCPLTPGNNPPTTIKVSQSGKNITVVGVDKNIGTYTGTTNDHDGFDVYRSTSTYGGTIDSSYKFEGASDGNAIATYTIDFKTSIRCTLGYRGTAVRQSR